jgi:hypothetical protein
MSESDVDACDVEEVLTDSFSEGDITESLGAQPFMFEPEASDSSSSDDAGDDPDFPESKLGNTRWFIV